MKIRAPFRYWGAKVRMAPWIIERLPPHDHFIEGCAGSAAVMAVKPPVAAETLNDTYGEVVNFFRVLRDPLTAAELIDQVAFTPYALEEFRDALDAETDDPVERARAFFIRMQMAVVPGRTGWSYGVKGTSAKKANKPGRWATMPELLRLAAARFERVQIEQRDVLDLIDRYDAPGVLMLIDPPYAANVRPRSTGSSSGYVDDDFDHVALIERIMRTKYASHAITHYPTSLYREAGLQSLGYFVSHRNQPNGKGRSRAIEGLWLHRGSV